MKRAALVFALMLAPPAAIAQPAGSIYRVEPVIDSIGSVAMFAVGALIDAEKDRWAGLSPCTSEGRLPTKEELEAFEKLEEQGGVCGHDSIGVFELFVVQNESEGARFA